MQSNQLACISLSGCATRSKRVGSVCVCVSARGCDMISSASSIPDPVCMWHVCVCVCVSTGLYRVRLVALSHRPLVSRSLQPALRLSLLPGSWGGGGRCRAPPQVTCTNCAVCLVVWLALGCVRVWAACLLLHKCKCYPLFTDTGVPGALTPGLNLACGLLCGPGHASARKRCCSGLGVGWRRSRPLAAAARPPRCPSCLPQHSQSTHTLWWRRSTYSARSSFCSFAAPLDSTLPAEETHTLQNEFAFV